MVVAMTRKKMNRLEDMNVLEVAIVVIVVVVYVERFWGLLNREM